MTPGRSTDAGRRQEAGQRLNVLVAGGSSPSGIAAARALRQEGFAVYTAGSSSARIEAAALEAGEGVVPLACDLADLPGVRNLRDVLAGKGVTIDAVIHLVGGWRGAADIPSQTDEDWDFLERSAVTTLRNVSRVFYEDLASSPCGRLVMVSSTAVSSPPAGSASYAAAKAAAETWTMAVADGFRRSAAAGRDNQDLQGAAVVLVVKALVDDGMRRQHPERTFPGHTDVADLAGAVVGLFRRPAGELNGRRILLAPGTS